MRILLLLFTSLLLWTCHQKKVETKSTNDNVDPALTNPLMLDSLLGQQPLVKILKGKIGDDAIEMQLYIDSTKFIRGSYFYEKYQTLLHFKGALSEDGRMALKVYDITKEEVENFKGRITSDWTFSGIWFKIEAGAEKLPFALAEIQPLLLSNAKIEGTYQFDTATYQQTLSIRKVKNNQFEFQISIRSLSCTGEIEKGVALFHNKNNANFYGEEDCYINFDFNGNWINVGGLCAYFHGMKCSFDGGYKKISNQVNWIDDFYETDDFDEDDVLELGE